MRLFTEPRLSAATAFRWERADPAAHSPQSPCPRCGTIGAMSDQHGSDYIDRHGFRANVGIVLMRDTGELFLGGRVGGRGWQFPQGGVNRGERVEDALFRELTEEIGLEQQHVEVLGSTQGWLRYRLPRQYVRDR